MVSDILISVVEDDQLLCDSIKDLMLSHGFRATGSYNAESFNQTVDIAIPDILIVDLNLPGEDGISIIRRTRITYPDMSIIVLTARSEQYQRFEGYDAGVDVFLTKPSSAEELLTVVRRLSTNIAKVKQPSSDTFRLDQGALQVMGPSGLVCDVSQRESLMLKRMLESGQHGVSSTSLRDEDSESPLSKQALQVGIVRLREKLVAVGAPRRAVAAIRGYGYRLTIPLLID